MGQQGCRIRHGLLLDERCCVSSSVKSSKGGGLVMGSPPYHVASTERNRDATSSFEKV